MSKYYLEKIKCAGFLIIIKKMKDCDTENPFLFEKNFTKLTVLKSVLLDTLVATLQEYSLVTTLSIKVPIHMGQSAHITFEPGRLSKVQKVIFSKQASALMDSISSIVALFSRTIVSINAHRVTIPHGLIMPRLRYLRFVIGDFYCAGVDQVEQFPNLTRVHVPNFPQTLTCLSLDTGFVYLNEYSTTYNAFYVNVLRNQKREKIALLVYWALRARLGKDAANLVSLWVLKIPNTSWKLEEVDFFQSTNDRSIMYFTRDYSILKQMQHERMFLLDAKREKTTMDRTVLHLEQRLATTKRTRAALETQIELGEQKYAERVDKLKKYKTLIVDEEGDILL